MDMPTTINSLDLVMAVIILLLGLRGMLHGFIAEISGLVALLMAVFAAGNSTLNGEVARLLSGILTDPAWAHLLSYVGIFIAVFLLAATLFRIADKILSAKTPNWVDRLLGLLAGGIKGVVFCTLLLVCIYYLAPDSQIRRGSMLAPYMNELWENISRATDGFHKLPELGLPKW